MQVFTIVARNYLALALTLADSVRRFHPEAELLIVLADGTDGLLPEDLRYRVESATAFLGDEFDVLAFQYDVTEFCTAIKPFVFARLLAQGDGAPALYLDPDMLLYGRLDPVLDLLEANEIVLTPHLLDLQPIEDRAYPEYLHLWTGIFNLGFCALRPGDRSRPFVDWWSERLRRYCFADRQDGLHTDQKWLDYVPVFFGDTLGILRHRGVNVAYWNLDERPLTRGEDGVVRAGSDPLLLFHFSGFRFATLELTKQPAADDRRRYDPAVLDELSREYRDAVFANGYERVIALPYGLARYSDGTPITMVHRRLFRVAARRPVANPFQCHGPFLAAIRSAGLIDRSAAASSDYSSRNLKGLGRATRLAEAGLRLLVRLLGARRYGYLIKFFGRYGRTEAHSFLLRNPHD